MKIKASVILLLMIGAFLIFDQWNRHHATHTNTSGNQPPTVLPSDLKDIIQHGYKDGAWKARLAMEEFLKTWDPVGHSAEELKSLFGNPGIERSDLIRYHFDNGANGWMFDFKMQNGMVVSVQFVGA